MDEEEFEKYTATLKKASASIPAAVTVLNKRKRPDLKTESSSISSSRTLAESNVVYGTALIRTLPGEVSNTLELRISVVGNVDAGKSTLLGVLTKDMLDDGRGKARVNLFKHKHEIESGRTSSIGLEIMGFDAEGQVITPSSQGKAKLQWEDICTVSSKVILKKLLEIRLLLLDFIICRSRWT